MNHQAVRDRIAEWYGALADRLRKRVGRAVGACRTCGKPTRSHTLGSGVQCHACCVAGERVIETDGGRDRPVADDRRDLRERVETFVANHPGTSVMDVLTQLRLAPEHRDIVEDVLGWTDERDCERPRPCKHENPIDAADVSGEERAQMLLGFLDRFRDEFGRTPKLMPLDEGGKAPWIAGRCSLDSAEADAALIDGYEAARQMHHDGARGFAIYAGRPDHGTGNVAFVDHDDPEAFPAPTGDPTLAVLSGSGRGPHETYRNDASDPVRNARVGNDDGEVRAENWYVVVPGSVHPSGGVYHVIEERPIATLADGDLTDDMRPSSGPEIAVRERSQEQGANDELVEYEQPELENPEPTAGETSPEREGEDVGHGSDGPSTGSEGDSIEVIQERRERAVDHLEADGRENRLEYALDRDDELRRLFHAKRPEYDPDDRSLSEWRLVGRLAFWFAGEVNAVAWAMSRSDAQKWHARSPGGKYRKSRLKAVGKRTEFYDPEQLEADGPGESTEPTAALAFKRLAALAPGQRERYRQSLPADVTVPTSDEVSKRIRDAVDSTLRDEGYAVIRAPTASNKTGVAAETIWRLVDEDVTGDRPVVLFSETTDARDEAIERAREADLDVLVLRGYQELCPVARGEYDPANVDEDDSNAPSPLLLDGQPAGEWFTERVERRGVPISSVHTEAETLAKKQGRELTCCVDDCICHTKTQWPEDGLTGDDGPHYDLVIATDPFAFVPSLRTETNVIHDEQPTYTEDFGLENPDEDDITARVRDTVTAYLALSDDGPDTFEALVELARSCARCDAVPWNEHAFPEDRPDEELGHRWIKTFAALEHEPDRRWYLDDPRAHTLAPALARAIWKAITDEIDDDVSPDERDAGVFDRTGRTSATVSHAPPRLDDDARDDDGWNRVLVTVTLDDENTVRSVRNVPDFSTARSVVGLDARPSAWLWQRNVHADMTTERPLAADEARLWRRYERGQTVVQVGDATRPAGKEGKYFNERHARAIIGRLREHSGDEFRAVGTAKAVEDAGADHAGELVDVGVRQLMREAGIPDDGLATMTFGAEKSRNDFARELIGLVYGCIDPGDDYVLDLLAECGLDAEPEQSTHLCDHCDGEGCYKCDDTGHKRAHGREFVGPDADHAAELLESVRANHVAQMIGRFGRDLDVENGERNLTFVATDAVPDDLIDYQVPGVQWLATDTQREIVETLADRPEATTREIADVVGCSKEHVRQTLVRFEDRGVTVRSRRAGEHGADKWRGEDEEVIDGVQLRLDQITNHPVLPSSTWSLAILDRHASSGPLSLSQPSEQSIVTGEIEGDPPPR